MKKTANQESNLEARLKLVEYTLDEYRWRILFLKNELRRGRADRETWVEPTYKMQDFKRGKEIRFIYCDDRYWLHFGDALSYIGKSRRVAAYHTKRYMGSAADKFLIRTGGGVCWTIFATLSLFSVLNEQKKINFSKILKLFSSSGKPLLPIFED